MHVSDLLKLNKQPSNSTKCCTGCSTERPATLEFFYASKDSSDGLTWFCKTCIRTKSKLYAQQNKDANCKRAARYHTENRDERLVGMKERHAALTAAGLAQPRQRAAKLKAYGLSMEVFAAMTEAQGFRCAICRADPDGQNLHVDHDHETGAVRGLLCGSCNRALGLFQDDHTILQAAIEYLKRASAKNENEKTPCLSLPSSP
jgi:hypothetical protein